MFKTKLLIFWIFLFLFSGCALHNAIFHKNNASKDEPKAESEGRTCNIDTIPVLAQRELDF